MAKSRRRVRGEGTVYQRKSDGRWVGSFKTEDGKRKYVYGDTQKEALEKLKNAQREYEQGVLVTGPQQTVKQYLEYWIEDVQKTKIRLTTYQVYRSILRNHLIPGLGHIRLQKLTAQHVQSFYAKRQREGCSASRVRNIHVVLHNALGHAKRLKLVGSNVRFVRVARRRDQPI